MDNLKPPYWVINLASIILCIVVGIFTFRDWIRPFPLPKDGSASRDNRVKRLSSPLKWILLALVCSLIRACVIIALLAGVPVAFLEITQFYNFFGIAAEVLAFITALRVTRRFQSPSSTSEEEESSYVPTEKVEAEKKLNTADIFVMTLLATLGFTYWTTDLGASLRLNYGKRKFRNAYIIFEAVRGLLTAYNVFLVITAIYISTRLLSKRRNKATSYSASATPTDLNARVTFTLKTIPTIMFVSIIIMVSGVMSLFIWYRSREWTYTQAYEALTVLNLLAKCIGEVLLLEFSRGALRRMTLAATSS
ncbi:hypothetical protein QBC38DRAFT_550620 [Podospora fimiseda]|uniref:Uncharacterized protein n=1 Tax=Podospora fimiseda TaxID=252190 RepID=A0AAN7BEM6_9PEZI|nr:hypothetical protein QBC38DRAFT_550620 [Podospora fimiseda]